MAAFIGMNLDRHPESFKGMYPILLDGDTDKAEGARSFDEGCFALPNLTAEPCLETILHDFKEYALPQGKLP